MERIRRHRSRLIDVVGEQPRECLRLSENRVGENYGPTPDPDVGEGTKARPRHRTLSRACWKVGFLRSREHAALQLRTDSVAFQRNVEREGHQETDAPWARGQDIDCSGPLRAKRS